MLDREKVIKNLQSMANICALNGDIQSMRTIDDAIFLLSDLKPIVTTNAYGKEFYKCANCGHRHIPSYTSVFLAMHVNRTRYMKCPKCRKFSWQKKVLSKED